MSDKFQNLEATLNALIGQACWDVMVRGGLDNGATLSMGDKIPRTTPLNAPNLPIAQQQYRAAYELIIADATWRLDSPDHIVTSWSDEAAHRRDMMAVLIGQKVSDWNITWPGLDLTIHFNNGLALRIFCDQTDPDESGENYTLVSPQHQFTVGIRSELTQSTRPKS